MAKNKENIENANENHSNSKIVLHILLLAGILIAVAVLAVLFILSVKGDDITLSDANSTLVLSFIGVVATFIVVGNYVQVMDIKKAMEQDLENKEKTINTLTTDTTNLRTDLNTQIEKLGKRVGTLEKYTEKHIDDLATTINEQSDIDKLYTRDAIDKALKHVENYKRLVFDQMVTLYGETNDVMSLMEKLYKRFEQNEYSIQLSANAEVTKASAKLFDDRIEFYKEDKWIDPETIDAVDGIKITARALFTLFSLYSNIKISPVKTELSDAGFTNTDTENENDGNDSTFNNKSAK